MHRFPRFAGLTMIVLLAASSADAQLDVRIKDLTDIEGVRTNKLLGMGLVTGLNGTGGKSPITRQFAQNFQQRFGIRATPEQRQNVVDDAKLKTDNLAVVMVTAEIPPFARPGSRIDVMVSAFDDASSIQGGHLIETALRGVDDRVYGLASGPVSIGGFSFSGDAARVQKNHPTVGRIPNALTLEEAIDMRVGRHGRTRLLLRQPDFATASRIASAINAVHPIAAHASDPGTVEVVVPGDRLSDVNGFFAEMGALRVHPDVKARVVINERTGTVIVGEHVRIGSVAVTHANLAIVTVENPQISQPAPFSDGVTADVPRTTVNVHEERKALTVVDGTTTVGDLAQALNALGVTPRDLSSIFQQLKAAGALHAELRYR